MRPPTWVGISAVNIYGHLHCARHYVVARISVPSAGVLRLQASVLPLHGQGLYIWGGGPQRASCLVL